MEVIGYKLGGNSFPLIVQEGTQKLLVKLRGGMSGPYALLSEWFGNALGEKLGLVTRPSRWIYLSDTLKYDTVYVEVRDLIEKSRGLNICFEYIEAAQDVSPADFELLDKPSFVTTYLFDVLMLNIDRTGANFNLLMDPEGQFIVSDFESSLLFNDLLNGSSLSKNERVLQCLKANVFYQRVNAVDLEAFVNRLNAIDFNLLLKDLPPEALAGHAKEALLEALEKRQMAHWGFRPCLTVSILLLRSPRRRSKPG